MIINGHVLKFWFKKQKPKPKNRAFKIEIKDKNQRYRQKMQATGRCQHCGKPCAPYFDCAERREYKKRLRFKKKLAMIGTTEAQYKQLREERKWQRVAKRKLTDMQTYLRNETLESTNSRKKESEQAETSLI